MVEHFPAATDKNKLGVVGYGNEYPSSVDLREFLTQFRTDAAAAEPTIETIYRHYRGQLSRQANLDIQYTLALAYPTPVIYYMGTGNGVKVMPSGKLADTGDQYQFNYMSKRLPQTIGLGYGTPETSIPPEYARALCEPFAWHPRRERQCRRRLMELQGHQWKCPVLHLLPCILFVYFLLTSAHRHKYKSLTRPSYFCGSLDH